MRRWLVAAIGSGLVACTMLTDLDGLSIDGPGNGDDGTDGATSSADGAVITSASEAGADATLVTCEAVLDSDPKNCGTCGKDCLGGKCSAGRCEAAVLARDLDSPLGIAISRGKLYVGQKGGLTEIDLDGQNRKIVAQDGHAKYVWGTDTDVFFSGSNANILRWSHTDDGKTNLVLAAPDVHGVAVTSTHVIYTRYAEEASSGGVYRQPYPGSTDGPDKLKAWNHAETVTLADGTIYFAGDGDDVAMRLNGDGTTDKLFGGGGTTGIFVIGDDAFVTRQGAGEVHHVSLATKQSERLVAGLGGPSGIVATATTIYWVEVNSGQLGALVR